MISKIKKTGIAILALLLATSTLALAQDNESVQESNNGQLQNRIDFGNAYIMGQSIKSGSVYLLHRKKSEISSMLQIRTDFRKEIIEDFSLEDTKIINENDEADEKG